ncbi:hypothetical protein EJ08DRAFT_98124 [Tothia fuscella]|uniref:Uncharacterized protein n=1 Tax=Tothia fuscella TaxID=1048955 RepID=A0A9P4TS30_9PEZI|nr:hypothetical protein EJ08DRAFT_98124 [Tothia fuscella]
MTTTMSMSFIAALEHITQTSAVYLATLYTAHTLLTSPGAQYLRRHRLRLPSSPFLSTALILHRTIVLAVDCLQIIDASSSTFHNFDHHFDFVNPPPTSQHHRIFFLLSLSFLFDISLSGLDISAFTVPSQAFYTLLTSPGTSPPPQLHCLTIPARHCHSPHIVSTPTSSSLTLDTLHPHNMSTSSSTTYHHIADGRCPFNRDTSHSHHPPSHLVCIKFIHQLHRLSHFADSLPVSPYFARVCFAFS